jgi:hypothetical protein
VPAELQRAGFSPILSSCLWTVLRAVLIDPAQDGIARGVVQAKDSIGHWPITSLEIGDRYMAMGEQPPFISFEKVSYGTLLGEYSIGLSSGGLEGHLRKFGGTRVLLFGFEGSDEMDPASGAGWAELAAPDRLEGEFLNDYGRFVAVRGTNSLIAIGFPRRRTR